MRKSKKTRMYSLYGKSSTGRWRRIGACGLPLASARQVRDWKAAVAMGGGVMAIRPTGSSAVLNVR